MKYNWKFFSVILCFLVYLRLEHYVFELVLLLVLYIHEIIELHHLLFTKQMYLLEEFRVEVKGMSGYKYMLYHAFGKLFVHEEVI